MPLAVPKNLEAIAAERFEQWQAKATTEVDTELYWIRRLLLVSDYAFEWALKQPQWLAEISLFLTQDFASIEKQFVRLAESDIEVFSEFELKQWLRHQRHYYSIACATFQLTNHLNIRQITKLQSMLARSLIALTYRWLKAQFNQRYGLPSSSQYSEQELVIMLMGKLGGGELNFSSDIDLIFCYPEEGETNTDKFVSARRIENQKYFLRLAQRLVALLHETTADGFVYRVDMRLRPYGDSGALTLNFDAMADYYLEQGREWERFAMIKAAYWCPDNQTALAIQQIITPFSFRRYIDFSVLDAIRQLKHKITSEMQHRNLQADIKLGQGGIRELEFIVQSLQLISGGRNPELQIKNWWQTLEVLTQNQLIPHEQATKLRQSYEFLRSLENVLQLQNNAQTQQLPSESKPQLIVAYAMGYENWNSLLKDLNIYREQVEEFFGQLFQDPNEDVKKDTDLQKTEHYLNHKSSALKFKQEQPFDEELLALAANFKQTFISDKLGQRGQKRLSQLLPYLLVNARKSTEPEQTFKRCLSLMQSIGKRTAYFELLVENPPLLEHLVILVSRSKWLVEQLKKYPSLLDELLFPANFGKILTKEDFRNALQQSLLRIESDNIEEQLVAIGRFKIASQFKVAAGFLNHRFHILEVTRQLTDIAEICLQALLRLAWRDLSRKHGVPQDADTEQVSDFLILGYGKLGSHELGFGSDLDLVFLYRGKPNTMTNGSKPIELPQFYTRLTQRLVHYLNTRTQQGIMYEVDTRLRPSGRSGLLVSEFSAFIEYQKHEAWTWEKQALVRARAVAGDVNFSQDYQKIRTELLQSTNSLVEDVSAMRQKMRENLDRSSDQQWDIKQGKGGLVDIEFLVQYWVLALPQKNVQLPDIYSNHFWLNWLEENNHLPPAVSHHLKNIYEQYQSLVNHKRLDMVSGILDFKQVEDSANFVGALWASTFGQ